MFDLRITTFHEFRMFVKLIRNEPITEEDIKTILPSFEKAINDLKIAEEAQKGK